MADVTFDEVIKLAQQLKPEEQEKLIQKLSERTRTAQGSPDEWMAKLQAAMIDKPISPDFSFRREDWYDDEGR